ncbi:MAG TPA: phasin family protein [Usitatibacter sp.]|nr:phasin family protein [Usitatibacter sp.]
MATRKSGPRARTSQTRDTSSDAASAMGDSAQKIWLAGLGAFERARAEGPRMFDTLVEQGKSLGGQAREAADQALRNLKEGASSAGGRFDKLEQVFEERVSRSLKRLGVLTRGEVEDLNKGVRDLADQVRDLMSQQKNAASRSSTSAKRTAKRAAGTVKKTARKTAKRAKRATRGSRAPRA